VRAAPASLIPAGARDTGLPAAIIALQRSHGNRYVARELAAKALPLTDTSWSERATPENQRRAAAMDELEKLTDDQLIRRRAEVAVKAIGHSNDEQQTAQRTLEDIEGVAEGRQIKPMAPNYSPYSRDQPVTRRLNVRAHLEEGVRLSGSFAQALKGFGSTSDIESDLEHFKDEAKAFESEFRSQARTTAERMLDGSQRGIKEILESYGLPYETAKWAAENLARGGDLDEEAGHVVGAAVRAKQVDAPARVRKRVNLANRAHRLRQLQQLVAQRQEEARAATKPIPGAGSRAEAPDEAAEARLWAARQELNAAWLAAEQLHPVIAGFRRGGDVEKVDLAGLDTRSVEDEMKVVAKQILPKLRDIGRARHLLRQGPKSLDPLSMPSVVALTRTNMFIPRGSLRDGVANDLAAKAAAGSSSVWMMVASFALAVITLIPSAGASLAIPAGMAAIGLAAYSATEAWEEYSKQKILSNTDIDLARSLSKEDPSLTRFAVSLVSLGLEAVPIVGAINKARRLRRLVAAGEDTTATVRELNALGQAKGRRLGDEALADVRATTAKAPDKPPTTAADPPPGRPARRLDAPASTPPAAPMPKFKSVEQVKSAVTDGFATLKSGMDPASLPKEYGKMIRALKARADDPAVQEVLGLVDDVMGALRNPKLYGEVMGEAWARALATPVGGINGALLEMASEAGLTVRAIRASEGQLKGVQFFDKYASKAYALVDKPLAVVDPHGALTHLIQDLVVTRGLKAKGLTSAQFRVKLGKAQAKFRRPSKSVPQGEAREIAIGDYVWRTTYDLQASGHLPMPEAIYPVLSKLFKLK
jgi:hypothetical protein